MKGSGEEGRLGPWEMVRMGSGDEGKLRNISVM